MSLRRKFAVNELKKKKERKKTGQNAPAVKTFLVNFSLLFCTSIQNSNLDSNWQIFSNSVCH